MNSNDMNGAGGKPAVTASLADIQLLQTSLAKMTQADAAPQGPPALSATPTVSGLLHTLKRRWAVAVALATVLALVGGAGVFLVNWPKYVAKMRIQIAAKQMGPEDIEYPIFKANMEALIKSPLVLSAALNEKTADGREIKDFEIVRDKGMVVIDWLELALKTDFLLGPEVLRVSLAEDHPEEVADLLNAIGKSFINEYNQMEKKRRDVRLAELRTKKSQAEQDLKNFRKDLEAKLATLPAKDREAMTAHREQVAYKLHAAENARRTYEDSIGKLEGDVVILRARLQNIDKTPVPQAVLLEIYGKDAILVSHQVRIAKVETDMEDYPTKYEGDSLKSLLVKLRKELIKLRDLVEKRENELRPKIETRWRSDAAEQWAHQIVLAGEQIRAYTKQRDDAAKEIADLEKKLNVSAAGSLNKPVDIAQAEDKIKIAEKNLDSIAQKIHEVELESPQSRVQIVTPASPPMARDVRTQARLAGAGGIGLFIMTLFGVAFFEFRSRRIIFAEDVAHGLGLNVVGTLPAIPPRHRKGSAPDRLSEQKWVSQLQESVDAIRTVILHQARTDALRVIMVTSAASGEGKTTLATQLAASLARGWKRTLVIDSDLRHPGAHRLFDVPAEPGLAEVLRGEVEPSDAIRATAFSRLWVLPAGNGDSHALQALAQDNVRALFDKLKEHYDFILIDTPPVLPVTDTLLLGQHVDGVVMAVLRDVSRAPAVYAAQQKLAPLGVKMLGAVVLGAASDAAHHDYGYALAQAENQ